MIAFPIYLQADAMDCRPACLQMIAKYYGRYYSLPTLREYCFITREGVRLQGLSGATEKIGFRTMGVRCEYENLINDVPLPFIAHWNQGHFVVVYKIKDNLSETVENLKAVLREWENKYCIVSTIDGIVSFAGVWKLHQNVYAQ